MRQLSLKTCSIATIINIIFIHESNWIGNNILIFDEVMTAKEMYDV